MSFQQVGLQNLAQTGRRHRFEPLKITPTKVDIARHHLGHAQTRCLPGDGFTAVDFTHDQLTDCFPDFSRREPALVGGSQFAVDRLQRGISLFRVAHDRKVKKSVGTGIPTHRVDRMHQPCFFAQILPQHRAVTVPQNHRQHIEGSCIAMRQSGNRPSQPTTHDLNVVFDLVGARSKGGRFVWDEHR